MMALRARIIKFSVAGFSAIRMGIFDAPDAPLALVDLAEKSGDLGDGINRDEVAEFHVLPVLRVSRPTTASAGRSGTSSGSVDRYSRQFIGDLSQPGR